MELITIKSDEKNVIITIPIDLLVFAANDNPTFPMRVVNEPKFIEKVINGLENYQDSNDTEIGIMHFHQCLDDIIESIYESGEDCIEEAELPLSLTEPIK